MAKSIKKDIVIIGGGPAGYIAAIRASQLGAKVTLVEKADLGGTCLHWGCIPTKSLLQAAETLDTIRKGRRYGVNVKDLSIDFKKLLRHKDQIIKTSLLGLQMLMQKNGIEVIKGFGTLLPSKAVNVKTETESIKLQASRIILATGSSCSFPPIPGIREGRAMTTDEVFSMQEIPESLAIIGSGPSGVELATIFSHLGSKVHLVEMLPQVLPNEDQDFSAALKRRLKKAGVKVYTEAIVEKIEEGEGSEKVLTMTMQEKEYDITVQHVIMAAGRKSNTGGLGLEKAGIGVEQGKIVTNERMETTAHDIYAAGDAVGRMMLAHLAFREGEVAAENALGQASAVDYRAVPRCVYSIPEVGSVGLSEREAIEKGHPVKVGRFPLTANNKALILGERDGFIKVIARADSGEILGIHMLSPHATELIGEAAVMVGMQATIREISSLIHAHPTLHEALKEAILDVEGRALHVPPSGNSSA